MEYCNAGDLGDYLQTKITLPETTIQHFLVHIARAIEAINKKGIVHRSVQALAFKQFSINCLFYSSSMLKAADKQLIIICLRNVLIIKKLWYRRKHSCLCDGTLIVAGLFFLLVEHSLNQIVSLYSICFLGNDRLLFHTTIGEFIR